MMNVYAYCDSKSLLSSLESVGRFNNCNFRTFSDFRNAFGFLQSDYSIDFFIQGMVNEVGEYRDEIRLLELILSRNSSKNVCLMIAGDPSPLIFSIMDKYNVGYISKGFDFKELSDRFLDE